MKNRTSLALSVLFATCLLFCAGCGDGGKEGQSEEQVKFEEKENQVTDRQLYAGGEVLFPVSLWQTPKFERIENYDRSDCGAEAYLLESVPYRGATTKVFVFVGLPEGASADAPVPAMVLVHGGLGTAFADWVQYWNCLGYAAIAMDTEGRVPKPDAGYYSGAADPSPFPHGPANATMQDGHLVFDFFAVFLMNNIRHLFGRFFHFGI